MRRAIIWSVLWLQTDSRSKKKQKQQQNKQPTKQQQQTNKKPKKNKNETNKQTNKNTFFFGNLKPVLNWANACWKYSANQFGS